MAPTTGQRHLLLVQPERNTAKTLCEHLETVGYEITPISDASVAFAHAKRYRPDLLMIDGHQANDTDFALLRQVRAECELNQAPVFILGHADAERSVWLRGLQEGAEDYIQRPFNLAEVQLRVQNRIHFAQRYPALDRTCRSGKILIVDMSLLK